jgi:type IX secretion system PorP/SprF family membrane protein
MNGTVCKYCLTSLLVFTAVFCRGQQQAMFTQYMFNGLVLNPAYAGSQETFTATAIMRKQWVGIDDAPQTQTFSAHSPVDDLRKRKRPASPVSLGLTLFHDRIAITDQTGLLASYAYRLKFLNNGSLSFGLQAGISQFRIRYSELGLDDPSFSVGDVAEWQPDFGAGIYYRTDRFYAGLSAPQMLRPKIGTDHSSVALVPNYFLTMGYLFDINRTIKLKPNVLVKSFTGDLVQLDVNCNVFLNEILNLGLSWRSFESIGTLIRFQVHDRFALGYAYDIPYGSEFAARSNGSHEIMVNYRVPKKKIRTVNPRFF